MDTEKIDNRERLWQSIEKPERTGWKLRNTVLVLRIGQYTPTQAVEQALLSGMRAAALSVFYIPCEDVDEHDSDACRLFPLDWDKLDTLPYAQMNERVRALGSYINSAFAYDAGIISVPGSAISVTDAQNSDLPCYLLSHHIIPAAVLCCLPARRYSEAQLDAISRELENRFGYHTPLFVTTDRPLTSEDTTGSKPRHVSRHLSVEQMPEQPTVEGLFSVYDLSPLVDRVLRVFAPFHARMPEADIKQAVCRAFHIGDLSEIDRIDDVEQRARTLYAICVYLYREHGLIISYDDVFYANAHLEKLIERAVQRYEQQ